MSQILVTGAAGFIGHYVVKQLEQAHTVVGLDNFTDYGYLNKEELEWLFEQRLSWINSTVEKADISEQTELDAVFSRVRPDTVVHLASIPRQRLVNANPLLGNRVIVEGLRNTLISAERHKVKRFVFVSSSMVYGNFPNDTDETRACFPMGSYAQMKYASERLVTKSFMDWVIVRPSAVYGERDVYDRVVSRFATNALLGKDLLVQGANQALDFTHVEDTAQGIALAATSDVRSKIYNITRSDPIIYTLNDLAGLCVDRAGRGTVKIADRDVTYPVRGRLSIQAARNDLGFDPKIDLPYGLSRYIESIRDSEYWSNKIN